MADTDYTRDRFRDADKSEEGLLLSRLKRVESNPSGVYSVHIHMSQLQASNRQLHLLRIATNSLLELEKSYEAKVFSMNNLDVILICRNVPVNEVESAIDMARYTFSEDPVLEVEGDIEGDDFEDAFTTWYDLSQMEDFTVFLSIANKMSDDLLSSKKSKVSGKLKDDKGLGEPLSAMNLDSINQSLMTVRISDLVHNQTCMKMGSNGPEDLVFKEHTISMDGLRARISPDVNLFASPSLFQFLTETLDKRMLSVLGNRNFDKLPFSISINLNVNTVLSRGFQKFDQLVGENTSKVFVEMQILDIFADMGLFVQARDTLKERGYKIVVDGLGMLALQFIDPAILRTDFVKLNWDSDYEDDVDPNCLKDLQKVISSIGKDRIILARVNTNKAVQWGMKHGIKKFQGFFVDALLEKGPSKKDPQEGAAKKAELVSSKVATPPKTKPKDSKLAVTIPKATSTKSAMKT
ncbi:MAG: hypothetical protein VX923_06480 [Pseudomonadota bacterium]|nr:hypothetical protein [Pseudomonadota bacterium]